MDLHITKKYKFKEVPMIKYVPPCWVNANLQRALAGYVNKNNIYFIGRGLWEATGGEDSGLVEFQKFLTKPGNPKITNFQDVKEIWNSFDPLSKNIETRTFLLASRPSIDEQNNFITCAYCRESVFAGTPFANDKIVIERENKKSCDFCTVVFSVVEHALYEVDKKEPVPV